MMAPTSGNPKDRKKEPPLSTPEALPAPRAGGRRGALRRLPTAREGRQTRASQRRRRRRSRATSTEGPRESKVAGNLRGRLNLRNDLRKERRIKKTGGGTGSDGQVTLLRVRDGQSSMGKHTLPTLGPKKSQQKQSEQRGIEPQTRMTRQS